MYVVVIVEITGIMSFRPGRRGQTHIGTGVYGEATAKWPLRITFMTRTTYSQDNHNTVKMAPRKRDQTAASSAPVTSTPQVSRTSTSSKNTSSSAQQIVGGIWKNYVNKTPQRVKLLDVFMAFLAVVGALQFVYCVIVGNFVSLLLTLMNWKIG